MAVTLSQLQDEITAVLVDTAPLDRSTSCQALGHAGRLLHQLAADGLLPELPNPREDAVHALADACAAVGAADPGGPHRRLGELMAATADMSMLFRDLSGRDARWALALEVSANVRRIVDHPTLDDDLAGHYAAPSLRRVCTTAARVERLGAQRPPDPAGTSVSERPLPVAALPPGLSVDEVIGESAAAVLHYSSGGRRAELTVAQVHAVCAAAQAVSGHAAAVASTVYPDDAGRRWRHAHLSWASIRHELGPLRDGTRQPGLAPPVVVWAIRLNDAVARATTQEHRAGPKSITGLQSAVRLLPLIAENLQDALGVWQSPGRVGINVHLVDHAVRDDWPDRVQAARITQIMARNPARAIAWLLPSDLTAAITALSEARAHSEDLALELQTMTTEPERLPITWRPAASIDSPSNNQVVAAVQVTAVSELPRTGRHLSDPPIQRGMDPGPDPAARWESIVLRAAGPAVIGDPGWPELAADLDRADRTGWDVATNLPRLVHQNPLPKRSPARELYYRLIADCDAAFPSAATANNRTAVEESYANNTLQRVDVQRDQPIHRGDERRLGPSR